MTASRWLGEALSGLEDTVVAWGASPLTLLVVVLLCCLDGFLPAVPSESVVIATASALVAAGAPVVDLGLLVAAAALGAFCGDLVAYGLGSRLGLERRRPFRGRRGRAALAEATGSLERHGGSYVLAGRFVPVGRVLVSLAAGASAFPRARFVPLTVLGSVLWGVWTCLFGIGAGHLLGDEPLLAMGAGVVAGVTMGLLVDRLLKALSGTRGPGARQRRRGRPPNRPERARCQRSGPVAPTPSPAGARRAESRPVLA